MIFLAYVIIGFITAFIIYLTEPKPFIGEVSGDAYFGVGVFWPFSVSMIVLVHTYDYIGERCKRAKKVYKSWEDS